MANYTTPAKVRQIIEVDPTIDLNPFISAAHSLVVEVCNDTSYDEDRLEIIEKYLSAHLYTLRDPRPVTEQAGSISVTYQSKVGLRLATSHYGQMAMIFDTAGGLSRLNDVPAAMVSAIWLGKPNE